MSPNLVLIGTLVKFATSTPSSINHDHWIDFFFFLNWFWCDRWAENIVGDYNDKAMNYHQIKDKSTIVIKIESTSLHSTETSRRYPFLIIRTRTTQKSSVKTDKWFELIYSQRLLFLVIPSWLSNHELYNWYAKWHLQNDW